MKKLKTCCCGLLLALFCWLPAISSAQATEATVTLSLKDFQALEQNYRTLEEALEQSAAALAEAKQLLSGSSEDLTQLQDTLNRQRATILQLQAELKVQKETSATLWETLTQLQQQSAEQVARLSKAEKYLNDTERDYQQEQKRIRRQVRLWQVIALSCAGIAAAR